MSEFFKFRELVERLGICRQTLRNWIAAGDFPPPHMTIGRRHFWRVNDVMRWEARAGETKRRALDF